jgi:hypothetical protein
MISLISSLKKNQSPVIIIEIIDQKSENYYKNLELSLEIIDTLMKNLHLKKDAEKSMTFYGKFF